MNWLCKIVLVMLAITFSSPVLAEQEQDLIGSFELNVPWLSVTGKNLNVTAFDDPKVNGVSCHVSDVVVTGLTWGDDPSNASIACRQVGMIQIVGATEENPWGDLDLSPQGEDVFGKTKGWFKSLSVRRFVDTQRQVLVYVVFTPKWGEDSNKNVVSTVSLF